MEISRLEYSFVLNIPAANLRNIIERIFELASAVMPLSIVLIYQYSDAENGKNNQKVYQDPVPKSTLYNHLLLFKFIQPSFSRNCQNLILL
jgi:hypothetical protein